jgi:mono/diheme cytochrome c family protein
MRPTTKQPRARRIAVGAVAAIGCAAIASLFGIAAHGGSPDATYLAAAAVSGEQAFAKECGACHMAYPPVFLPARSWAAITGDLANHFGEDASLDPATTKAIADYLAANAADTTPGAPAAQILSGIRSTDLPLRITEMPFWRRIHGEVPSSDFTSPQVKTKSNCLACHTGG